MRSDGRAGAFSAPHDASRFLVLAYAAAWLLAGCSNDSGGPEIDLFRIANPAVDEPSGLVVSRRQPDVLWTHNDAGDEPRIFAVDGEGGTRAVVRVLGATNEDWEDIAIDDAGRLFVCDCGNNDSDRDDLAVYRLDEPDVYASPADDTAFADERVAFRYPDQTELGDPARLNFDAEALFWAEDQLYLLTKHRSDTRTKLYRFPRTTSGLGRVTLALLGNVEVGGQVTGADATQDGQWLAVLTDEALLIFQRPESGDRYLDQLYNRVDLDTDVVGKNCESVAWDGEEILIGNEDGEVFRMPDPRDLAVQRYP